MKRLLPAAAFAFAFSFWPCLGLAALPAPPVPPENPITEGKRVLGKILFWDEQLASDRTVACGTCHQPNRAGSDGRRGVHPGLDQAFGAADDVNGSPGVVRRNAAGTPIADPLFGFEVQVGPRNAQPVMGSLWAGELFWDGRASATFVNPQTGMVSVQLWGALESQAVAPFLSAHEMATDNRTWNDVVARLSSVQPLALATYLPADVKTALAGNPGYAALFTQAFGSPAITAERIAFAIATYERTLVADRTPFDLGTLTPQQQQGFGVFASVNSACNFCHTAPLFTDNSFRNIGVRPIAEDIGRQVVTHDPADAGKFKVPTLRNVGLKKFFMHNGRQTTLEQVIDFYVAANGQVQFPQNQDPLMNGISIGPNQRGALVEFMRNGLTDPRVKNESFPFDRPILRSEQGDANRDGQVDAADRALFVGCYTGSGRGPVAAGCERLDMDGDGDIDCADWSAFQLAWTGPSPPELFLACVAPPTPVPAHSPWSLAALLAALVLSGAWLLGRRRLG